MDQSKILTEINRIFIEVLDEENIEINEYTTADDVDDWDSLTHMELIVAIEKRFKLSFTTQEIFEWENVGAMCAAIEKHLK
ncbi:MAG: acyl carrier protein [SAR324 cluster bacterium]|nr:acyl carrier protein [SAR324 cluster bacterium]